MARPGAQGCVSRKGLDDPVCKRVREPIQVLEAIGKGFVCVCARHLDELYSGGS